MTPADPYSVAGHVRYQRSGHQPRKRYGNTDKRDRQSREPVDEHTIRCLRERHALAPACQTARHRPRLAGFG